MLSMVMLMRIIIHYRQSIVVMALLQQWLSGHQSLPEHRIMLVALPGVGNVGKLIIDSLTESCEAEEVLRLIHPDMPPQASLDSQGLLSPPHISFHHNGELILVTANGQPVTPSGQHECALEILKLAKQSSCQHVITLAGMAATVGEEDVFLVCSDIETRLELEQSSADVRRDQPNGGVIGLVGLLSSLGPVIGMSSTCAISTTLGSSVDPIAAQRLLASLVSWFNLKVEIPFTTMDRMAIHMAMLDEKGVAGELSELAEEDNAPMLYS
ncbi:MAG: PAC2 family protein [Candidatus Poseidoniales archaeon]|jgi:proteasome assembly chaperone (PAC2) family protein|tara:strand:+ start:322 stop:1128 length:807 start_codon:yes stop_codon:yes gene_type:complete